MTDQGGLIQAVGMNGVQRFQMRFDDFDALHASIRDWDLDLVQLQCGVFQAHLTQVVAGEMLVSRARFCSKVEQLGSAPVGYRTFAFLLNPESRIQWRNHEVGGNDIMLFPVGGELHSISESDFHVITFSVPKDTLESHCEAVGCSPKILEREVFRSDPVSMARLRQHFGLFLNLDEVPCVGAVTSDLVELLVRVCYRSRLSESDRVRSNRVMAVDKVRECIAMSKNHLNLQEMTAVSGVSARTLEYAFREQYQMGPKAYFKRFRLHQVRRELCAMRGERRNISEVASEWGFNHMGQFAADYRKLFLELPSQTVRM
ncbi:helix-turn-helix domain-containing protein [Rubritalea tangerina]|uniref:Helix-turn-helix domain-containing protein n=1 Tax=Rubritalea tangerina TaxID=430798 RepID=A0ABW4ZEZ1_9BACT